jgi:hypothetical protein
VSHWGLLPLPLSLRHAVLHPAPPCVLRLATAPLTLLAAPSLYLALTYSTADSHQSMV